MLHHRFLLDGVGRRRIHQITGDYVISEMIHCEFTLLDGRPTVVKTVVIGNCRFGMSNGNAITLL